MLAKSQKNRRGVAGVVIMGRHDLERGTAHLPQPQPLPVNNRSGTTTRIPLGIMQDASFLSVPIYSNNEQINENFLPTPTHDISVMPQSRDMNSQEAESLFDEPRERYSCHWMNVLRWEWLSVYRRLNLIVVLANLVIIIIFAAQGSLTKLDPGAMATALAVNVTLAVLFRQEYVVNALFLIFGCCPPSWPLWTRRLAAKIYHFGGIHSGTGLASILWLALFDMALALQYRRQYGIYNEDAPIVALTATLNLLLVSVVITSHPTIREKYHDLWEMTHRFGGWLAVVLFWIVFGLLVDQNRRANHPDDSIAYILVTSPTFWLLVVITVCLILPWLRLRRVSVVPEPQSRHAIRLHFDYTNLPLCAAPRLSRSPLIEWHSFAGIPEASGVGFSVLISGVGDWTKAVIRDPPTHMWVRGIPVRGVLHIAPIFRKVVLVATGSGIGPVLSLLSARNIPCRIIWCTRDPKDSYRQNVIEEVLRADPEAKIITRQRGRTDPHLGREAYQVYRESGAEAVFVISNKKGCYEARIWLESRGVVVFTPIFDS